jgi:hypothetical protein
MYDSTHADRLEAWREHLREDIPLIHKGLSRLFSQHRVRVVIENVGSVSAEGLSLEMRSGNAVVHALPYWVLVDGPPAPEPRYLLHPNVNFSARDLLRHHREQFVFYWDETGPGDHVIISCSSFRQAKSHEVELSIELLAGSIPKVQIEAIVTATNMKGDARTRLIVPVEIVTAAVDDLYDISGTRLVRRPPFDLPDRFRNDDFAWYRNNGSLFDAE